MKKNIILLSVLTAITLIMCNTQTSKPDKIKPKITQDIKKDGFISKSIDSDVDFVKTELEFPFGELNINSENNTVFFNGEFTFTNPEWEPNISYSEDKKGLLKIEIDEVDFNKEDENNDDKCLWDLKFNKKTKNDLNISILAGEANINLAECNLKDFNFKMLAGEININLQNTSVPNINFKALAGDASFDLTGKWKNDLHAVFKGGVGELTIKLPADVGIKAEIIGLLGNRDVIGLEKNGSTYTNSLYDNCETNLYLDITGGIGDVKVEVVE